MERFYPASDLANFYRKPSGWALVGDAGLHQEPYMALVIRDALRDAELLAEAIMGGLAAQRDMEGAMAEYEKRRKEASALDFGENIASANYKPPSQLYAIRAAVRNNPEDAKRLFKAKTRRIEPSEFFNPENLDRLMGGASALPAQYKRAGS
jgi:flavin-dependent dehydrogenase